MTMSFYTKMREDFVKILTYNGAYVTRIPIIKSVDAFVGAETLSDGIAETILVSVAKMNTDWKYSKIGEMESGDLTLYATYTQEVNKNDKIILNERIYRIKNTLNIYEEGQVIFKKCELYLIE